MSDGLVTWYDVARWLPIDVRDALLMSMPPEQRGWWTEAEADADGGRFAEVTTMSDARPRHYKIDDIVRTAYLPSIVNVEAPTTAEIVARSE